MFDLGRARFLPRAPELGEAIGMIGVDEFIARYDASRGAR